MCPLWSRAGSNTHPIWACHFLPIVDLFFRQFYALFIIELGSRRAVHVGVTDSPTDAWLAQLLRDATPFGEGPNYLIRDNDSTYGSQFATVAARASVKALKLPVGAPNADAVCERFLGPVRRACLDPLLLIGQRSVTRFLKEYVDYFNQLRLHQGLEQRIPEPSLVPDISRQATRVMRTSALGGLHHAYQLAA